jgi:hypothetical protein
MNGVNGLGIIYKHMGFHFTIVSFVVSFHSKLKTTMCSKSNGSQCCLNNFKNSIGCKMDLKSLINKIKIDIS